MSIKIPLDFTGVEGRTTVRVSEGDYAAKIVEVKKTVSKSSGNPMLVITFEGLTGELKGRRIKDNHVLMQDNLWTLRNMLENIGYKVKPSKMTFTDAMVMNKKVGLTLVDGDEYKGRIKSEVADYIPVSAVGNKVSPDEVEEDDPLAGLDDMDDEEGWEEEEETEASGDGDDGGDTTDTDLAFEGDDEDDEEDDKEEDDESFDFAEDEEEEDDEEEVELSFSLEDVSSGKSADLKGYLSEAIEAGWEFDLTDKPKVAEVREVLTSLFEDEEDDEDMEGFSLDDME